MIAYKVFTHDLRPPVQGGEPVWSGDLPHTLPQVAVDASDNDCGAGWNACASAATALRIAGMWPNGRPSRVFALEGDDAGVYTRGDKLRASTWTITRELTGEEIAAVIRELSAQWFGPRADEMAAAQLAWREAFGRPLRDAAAVEAGLRAALNARGLPWGLKRFDSAWDARASRAAWDDWDAWDAWDAWASRDAWDAWDAWASRAARAARAAWDAWAALVLQFAAGNGWVTHQPQMLTTGIIDAYRNGLAVALPTGPNELGWAMEDEVKK